MYENSKNHNQKEKSNSYNFYRINVFLVVSSACRILRRLLFLLSSSLDDKNIKFFIFFDRDFHDSVFHIQQLMLTGFPDLFLAKIRQKIVCLAFFVMIRGFIYFTI